MANKEYNHQWYRNNKASHYRKAKVKRAERLVWINEYKRSKGCIDCPETDPDCLDFDHRDPKQKKFSIGGHGSSGHSLDNVETEIEKCDVRCSNCHRKKHARENRMKQEKVNEPNNVERNSINQAA